MPKRSILAGLSVLALMAAAIPAGAQSCGSEVEHLASQYNLSLDTPRDGSSGAPANPPAPSADSGGAGTTTAERASRAAGVLAPADTGSIAAVQPPATAPGRAPNTGGAAVPSAGGLATGDRARMESTLQQALAAERQGKLTECLDLLRKAAAVPGLPGTK
jgi:hypothetical protein